MLFRSLPEDLNFELVEPLRELFKDEVRNIGIELGIPHVMLFRHPFPGPGLGVRILGQIKEEYANILRLADHIFMEELHNENLYHEVNQAFAVFLPIKSVAVIRKKKVAVDAIKSVVNGVFPS